jgi:hypothetical protein
MSDEAEYVSPSDDGLIDEHIIANALNDKR